MKAEKLIGIIESVTSNKVVAIIKDESEIKKNILDLHLRIGQIGSYVVIPTDDVQVIGIITESRIRFEKFDTRPSDQLKEIYIQLVGTLRSGRFEKGVSKFPLIGDYIYATDKEDLKLIFSSYRDQDFSIGEISLLEGERQYLDPNKFFAKHIALMGSTGSGKSFTVSSLIQKVQNLENTHVIILDLHGEYEAAFKDTGNLIKLAELELPYWLMNFEEIQETFIDENEPTVNNQMMILKESILDSKKGKNPSLKEVLTIDTPVFFDFMDVKVRMQSLDTERLLGGKEGPFYGQFTRFLVRLDSKLNDRRYEFLFKPKNYRSSDTLPSLMSKLLGLENGKKITVIDMSAVPFDVANVLVSLLGRVIFDFNVWNKNRRDFPILIVFEEAHTYLSNTEGSRGRSARKTVERIAKEGRKYGVSCMIVSQRPAEISETVLSQCNNFVTMRLINPHDQNYVRKHVPEAMENFIDVLPTLRQGEAFILGDAVAIPTRVMIDKPNPEPTGSDIQFFDKWKEKESDVDAKEVIDRWWKQIRS
ncbi:MAG: ATP-binding protein [Bacteroidetes bacterium]|nr:ATP-binding protein [Bacteroidota bacterium]MBU1422689.1 ATP-binding protein [Bacteroidota bacterium]MBU2636542.1 ATP-binding protein [Bacteroidota bacterium]